MPTHTELPIASITADPDRPRHTLPDMERFTETVRTHGVLWPITVVERSAFVAARPRRGPAIPRAFSYVAVFGHRRLEAARRIGLDLIPAIVRPMPRDLDELTLLENTHRDRLTPLEEARVMSRMIRNGWTQTEISKALQVTQPLVSQRLTLLNLIPALQAALEEGTLKLGEARKYGRLAPHEQALLVP